jgi:hypothetical protein
MNIIIGQEDHLAHVSETIYSIEFWLHMWKAEDFVQLSLCRVVTSVVFFVPWTLLHDILH